MPCSDKFSMTLRTEILSTETVFLKQIFFLKSFNSVFNMKRLCGDSGSTCIFIMPAYLHVRLINFSWGGGRSRWAFR